MSEPKAEKEAYRWLCYALARDAACAKTDARIAYESTVAEVRRRGIMS